jgi:hypothetical protein
MSKLCPFCLSESPAAAGICPGCSRPFEDRPGRDLPKPVAWEDRRRRLPVRYLRTWFGSQFLPVRFFRELSDATGWRGPLTYYLTTLVTVAVLIGALILFSLGLLRIEWVTGTRETAAKRV